MVEQNKVPGVFTKELCESLVNSETSPDIFLSKPVQILESGGAEEDIQEEINTINSFNETFTNNNIDFDSRIPL